MGRRKEVLDKAVAQLKAEGIKTFAVRGDVPKPGEVASAVANAVNEMRGLDILVNGAAGNFLATAEGLRPGGFRTVMEIDAIGTFNMCHACHDQLRKSGDGVILNISANLHLPATWYQIHASAAKAAVDSITRSLALEWGTYKIRAVGIAPGPIEGTPGLKKLAPGANKDAVKKMVKGVIPLGRLGQSVDIGYAAVRFFPGASGADLTETLPLPSPQVFLCSPSASFISGSTLLVDGAQWLYQNQPVPRALVNRVQYT